MLPNAEQIFQEFLCHLFCKRETLAFILQASEICLMCQIRSHATILAKKVVAGEFSKNCGRNAFWCTT